tara:strand:- start:264 stop:611 length:348 start_codon:yes stop_codon:yes gene_type:complete
MSRYLENPPEKGLFGFTSLFSQPSYYYELWGRDKNKNPIFKWYNPQDDNWIDADIHGTELPKNALRYIGDYASKYQEEYLNKHGKPPWEFHERNKQKANELLEAEKERTLTEGSE